MCQEGKASQGKPELGGSYLINKAHRVAWGGGEEGEELKLILINFLIAVPPHCEEQAAADGRLGYRAASSH